MNEVLCRTLNSLHVETAANVPLISDRNIHEYTAHNTKVHSSLHLLLSLDVLQYLLRCFLSSFLNFLPARRKNPSCFRNIPSLSTLNEDKLPSLLSSFPVWRASWQALSTIAYGGAILRWYSVGMASARLRRNFKAILCMYLPVSVCVCVHSTVGRIMNVGYRCG